MPDLATWWPALLLAAVPSLLYVAVLRFIDRYEPDPWRFLLAALLVGAFVVPLLAMATRALFGQPFSLPHPYAAIGPQPVIRIVEQVWAGLALIAFVRLIGDEFTDGLDAVIYGAAIGAGLGAAHTFMFAAGGVDQFTSSTVTLLVVSGLNMTLYGGVFGAFLGYAYWYLTGNRRWIVVGLGLATAALLSSLHDTLPYMLARLIGEPNAATGLLTRSIASLLNILGLLALAIVVVHFWRHEANILRRYLGPEVEAGTIAQSDYDEVVSTRARFAAQWRLFGSGHFSEWRAMRRRFLVEGKLAFDQWHRARLDRAGTVADERTDALRDELKGLLPSKGGGQA